MQLSPSIGAVECVFGDTHCSCGGFQNPEWDCFVCPAAAPMDGDACTDTQAECVYGNTACSCDGFNNPEWSCQTCPASQPMDGDPCTEGGLFCDYMGTNCACFNQQWSCF